MNYEQFSPEAKQAIEHLRKFLIANKNKIENRKAYGYCFVDKNDYQLLWSITHDAAITFGVSLKESYNVAQFCDSKHYWLD